MPPRMIVSWAVRPSRVWASWANCTARGSRSSPSAMLRYWACTWTSTWTPGISRSTSWADLREQSGMIGQCRRVEIPQEDLEGDFGDATLDHIRMEKSLAPVAGFGGQRVAREAVEQTAGGAHGIDHAALGDRGMNVDAADGHRGQIGRERLHVNRVGPAPSSV